MSQKKLVLLWVPGAIVLQVCQLPLLQLGSTAQVSLLMAFCRLLGTESTSV